MSIENLQKPQPVKATSKTNYKVKNRDSSSYFYIGMSLFLMLVAFIGFWPSYFSTVLPGSEMRSPIGGVLWVIHLHAAVFVGWLVLLLIETVLITRKRIAIHMKIGRYAMFLGAAVFLTGLLVLTLQSYTFISMGEKTVTEGTVGTAGVWLQMVSFAFYYTWDTGSAEMRRLTNVTCFLLL